MCCTGVTAACCPTCLHRLTTAVGGWASLIGQTLTFMQTAPVYNKAVDTGADVLNKVQTTYVYKTAANRLYPVISNYADPVIDKVCFATYDRPAPVI
jgi:hypothetical protein